MKQHKTVVKSVCIVLLLSVLSTSPAVAQTITQIIDASGDGTNSLANPFGVAVDDSGNVYVTGQGSHNAFKITPGGVITQILDSTGNGTGTVRSPSGIAVDSLGNVYVSNSNYDKVLKITPGGGTRIILHAGHGLDAPREIAVDGSGNVYVAGTQSDNAFKITPHGDITEIINASGDGLNTLYRPYGIAVDAFGNVYVSGHYNSKEEPFGGNAFKITPEGNITEIIDATGDGQGHALDQPEGIGVDSFGNVYIGGWGDHVFKIDPDGNISVFASINDILGITVDGSDNVYLARRAGLGSAVYKITPSGVTTKIIDRNSDGTHIFASPFNITVDGSGTVYVPGCFSHNAFKITPAGTPTNLSPVADAGDNQTVEATSSSGAAVALDGSDSTDDGQIQPLTYTWTWTDGSATGVNPIVTLPLGTTMVTLTVYDGEFSNTDIVEIQVVDTTAPEITIDAPEPYGLYAEGDLAFDFSAYDLVSGSIEPPALLGTLSDPSGFSGTVVPGDVPSGGVYTLLVSAVDEAGNEADETVLFVVYDPSDGFVTGGGWIWSPEGAFIGNPSVTGKANFGFVSKYKKGATVPTGQTEFVFQAGNLNFHSSSYEWLVVTGSNYARFKGTGTINGAGEYKFMLWAGDGDPDTFRIKIWWEEGETENVVYDNGMDQAIGGGSIVIHTK